ncbi:hypothetical protein HMPREF0514_11571 [Lactobacillus paragasseri JV-V03]|uniref:Uncharacterized protein n=1 Tax=Lactobacillus paragasseri JV-V03 TaxID=525326 RepID=A0AA86ZZ22_9LACO|nr:hypothetical protein HMPREF0514_11571 [Lactobacillus paragasseri JV-V03]
MTVFYYTLDFVNKNTKSNFFETYFKDVSCETIIAVKKDFLLRIIIGCLMIMVRKKNWK